MESSDVKRLKELEEENARLKKMYADLAMDNHILKELFLLDDIQYNKQVAS
jgi:putative transposase